METNCAIHWIEIYPVDSAIRRFNNRGKINRYPVDTYFGNQLRYSLDKDLSTG